MFTGHKISSHLNKFNNIVDFPNPKALFLLDYWLYRVGNCAFLVANATKNFALATRISQLVAHIFPFGDLKKGQSPVGACLKS